MRQIEVNPKLIAKMEEFLRKMNPRSVLRENQRDGYLFVFLASIRLNCLQSRVAR
jgi:hypothetical protein